MANIIKIDLDEARRVQGEIEADSHTAQDAVAHVLQSPSRLLSWEGTRRKDFDSFISEDVRKLKLALEMIDQAAGRIRVAISRFAEADRP